MSKEIDKVVLLGDGVLVQKPIIADKIGSIHLPNGVAEEMLPMYQCRVVKVGPGDKTPMPVQVGDIAFLPKGPQYAQVQFDGQTHFIISSFNVLFCMREPEKTT
jgi:co-chaperonin GroES (HSP10)